MQGQCVLQCLFRTSLRLKSFFSLELIVIRWNVIRFRVLGYAMFENSVNKLRWSIKISWKISDTVQLDARFRGAGCPWVVISHYSINCRFFLVTGIQINIKKIENLEMTGIWRVLYSTKDERLMPVLVGQNFFFASFGQKGVLSKKSEKETPPVASMSAPALENVKDPQVQ